MIVSRLKHFILKIVGVFIFEKRINQFWNNIATQHVVESETSLSLYFRRDQFVQFRGSFFTTVFTTIRIFVSKLFISIILYV